MRSARGNSPRSSAFSRNTRRMRTVTAALYTSVGATSASRAPPRSRSARPIASTSSSTASRTCRPRVVVTSAWASALARRSASRVSVSAAAKKRRASRRATKPSRRLGSSANRLVTNVPEPLAAPLGAHSNVMRSPSLRSASATPVSRQTRSACSRGDAAQLERD